MTKATICFIDNRMDNVIHECIVCFFVVGLSYIRLVIFEYENVRTCVVLHSRTQTDDYELAIFLLFTNHHFLSVRILFVFPRNLILFHSVFFIFLFFFFDFFSYT